MTAAVPGAVMGRPSNADLIARLARAQLVNVDLQDELTALRAERDAIRLELVTLRNLLTYAFGGDRWDIALNVRDRLAGLGTTLARRGAV